MPAACPAKVSAKQHQQRVPAGPHAGALPSPPGLVNGHAQPNGPEHRPENAWHKVLQSPSQKDCAGTWASDVPGLSTDISLSLTRTCTPAASLVSVVWPGLNPETLLTAPGSPSAAEPAATSERCGALWREDAAKEHLAGPEEGPGRRLERRRRLPRWLQRCGERDKRRRQTAPPGVLSITEPSVLCQATELWFPSCNYSKLVGRPARSGQRGRWWTRPAMQRVSPWAEAGRWRGRRLSTALRPCLGRKPLLAPPLPEVRPSQHESRLAWHTGRLLNPANILHTSVTQFLQSTTPRGEALLLCAPLICRSSTACSDRAGPAAAAWPLGRGHRPNQQRPAASACGCPPTADGTARPPEEARPGRARPQGSPAPLLQVLISHCQQHIVRWAAAQAHVHAYV